MYSESQRVIKYQDVISGKVSSDWTTLPQIEPGYDSFVVQTKKPTKLVDSSARGVARYLSTLPVKSLPITLGEGATPLIPSKVFEGVYIKNEGLNPTGNFKDRESVVALAYANEQGYKNLAIASSGNAALSAAFYARLYNIRTTCYIPERTPSYKMDMITLFGAQTHIIGETYEDSYHYLLNNLPKGSINITSGAMPLRSEGFKTIAYEIWEELGSVPDIVLCPAGNGSAVSSVYHGFTDLKKWGLTNSIPKMVPVQIENADPINQALQKGEWLMKLKGGVDSECEAIVADESFCSPKAVHAVRESGGFGISVNDHQVTDGLRFAIDNEGIFPEFSSASVFAAMLEHEAELREKGKTIVLINTATGLKETKSLRDKLGSH